MRGGHSGPSSGVQRLKNIRWPAAWVRARASCPAASRSRPHSSQPCGARAPLHRVPLCQQVHPVLQRLPRLRALEQQRRGGQEAPGGDGGSLHIVQVGARPKGSAHTRAPPRRRAASAARRATLVQAGAALAAAKRCCRGGGCALAGRGCHRCALGGGRRLAAAIELAAGVERGKGAVESCGACRAFPWPDRLQPQLHRRQPQAQLSRPQAKPAPGLCPASAQAHASRCCSRNATTPPTLRLLGDTSARWSSASPARSAAVPSFMVGKLRGRWRGAEGTRGGRVAGAGRAGGCQQAPVGSRQHLQQVRGPAHSCRAVLTRGS